MLLSIQIIVGAILDGIFGDPQSVTHPVQRIGSFISYMEKKIRKWASGDEKKEFYGGIFLWISTVGLTYLITWGILAIIGYFWNLGKILVEIFFIYQILATRCLFSETMKVYSFLKKDDLVGARKALSYLVGRDTDNLTKEEVIKATVETIAENTADGVIAPLFYIGILGAPLGMAYKAVNTLDSMVGYRKKEYEYLGKCSARMDDVFNFIPARITAFLLILIAPLFGFPLKRTWKIYWRDRYQHSSPNSGQTEAVVAGAFGIQLGGTHSYFGKPVVKPTIGEQVEKVECKQIIWTNYFLVGATVLMIGLIVGSLFVVQKFLS